MRNTERKSGAALDHRVSVSLTREQHEFLAAISEKRRVSIAWVVRDAVERLIAQEKPLFEQGFTQKES